MLCTADQLQAVLRLRRCTSCSAGNAVLSFEPWVQVFGSLDELLDSLNQRPRPGAPAAGAAADRRAAPRRAWPRRTGRPGDARPPTEQRSCATWAAQSSSDGRRRRTATALIDHQLIRNRRGPVGVERRAAGCRGRGRHLAGGRRAAAQRALHRLPAQPAVAPVRRVQRPPPGAALRQPAPGRTVRGVPQRPGQRRLHASAAPPVRRTAGGLRHPGLAAAAVPLRMAGRRRSASPFRPDSSARVPGLGVHPADDRQRAAGASRWSAAIWADDPELQQRFPDPFGTDAEAFRDWCTNVAVANGQLPAGAVRGQPEHQPALVDQLGVSVVGEGLLAELVRVAVQASGLPSADEPHYPVVLRCTPGAPVPPDRHLIDVCPEAADASRGAGCCGSDQHAWAEDDGSGGPPVLSGTRTCPSTRARARWVVGEFVVVATDHSDGTPETIGVVLLPPSPARKRPPADRPARQKPRNDSAWPPPPTPGPSSGRLRPDGAIAAADCVVVLNRSTGSERAVLRLMDVAVRGVSVTPTAVRRPHCSAARE